MSQPIEELQEQLEGAIRVIEGVMSAHEAEVHGGGYCNANRLSAVAWFMHRMGVRLEGLCNAYTRIGNYLEVYEAGCPNCQHAKE